MSSPTVGYRLFRRPLPWLTAALAGGILLAGESVSYGLFSLSALLMCTVVCAATAVAIRRTTWLHLTILSLAAALGFMRLRAQQIIASNDVSYLAPADVQLTGFVNSEVRESYSEAEARTHRARLTLHALNVAVTNASSTENISGDVDVSVPITASSSGEVAESLHYGDEISAAGRLELPAGPRNPGSYDERTTLARKGIYSRLTVTLPESWRITKTAGAEAGALKLIFGLKELVLSHGRKALNRERAGVLNAILLGAKSELSPADRALFEKTGTVHLLATAGLHTGIIVAMLLYLLPFAGLPRRYVVFLTLVLLVVFSIMSGDRPAVVRAAIMAAVYLVGMLLEREPDLANAIALAAMGLLLANPFSLFDFGFQISFATVITLVLAMKLTLPIRRKLTMRTSRQSVWENALNGAGQYLVTCGCVTVVAQIGSMPLILYYFNILAPAGLLANLVIVPIVAPVMALGFAAAALGTLSPFLSLPLDWMLNILTEYILAVVRLCTSPQFGVTSIGSPPVWSLVLYYASLWGWLGWLRVRSKDRGLRT